MKLRVGPSAAASPPEPTTLTPVTRFVLVAVMVAVSFPLGALMDVSMLVVVLGLLNMSVIVFLLLKKDITWGFLFYLTAVIFFQTGFWIRLPGFPDLYPARIASMLLYLVFLAQILLSMRVAPKLGPIEKSMIIFMVILFISIVTSGQRPRWLLLMRGYIYPFMFFYFARAAVSQKRQVQIVMGYLVILGIYLGVMGIFEKMKWYHLVFPRFIVDPSLADKGLSRLGFRVRGIFLQPAILGTVMVMAFFPSMLYLSRLRGMIPKILQLVLLAVTPLTIFFTQTRSVYAGFALALGIGAFWSRRLRPLCVGIILAAMTAAFLNWDNLSSTDREKGGMGTVNTIHYRIEILYEAVDIFVENPFFGCGFMNFSEVALEHRKPRDVPFFGHIDLGVGGDAVLHNIFVTVFAEQGLTGLVPYLAIFWFIWRVSRKAYRIMPREGLLSRDWVVCCWCAMAGFLVNGMLIEVRYFEYINVLFFFLMGTLVGMYERRVAELAAAAEEGEGRGETPAGLGRPVLGAAGRSA
jgi:O-antigen ligase